MERLWLLLDCNYLCYRALYSTGSLAHEGAATGVLYGFFRELATLKERFPTAYFCFCFDHGKSLRQLAFTDYKLRRSAFIKDEQQAKAHDEMKVQISRIKYEYLEKLKRTNIFFQRGYEADDMIGSICRNLYWRDHAVIISADKDFYQLLSHQVSMWDPRKKTRYTLEDFEKEYEITPDDWITVKAISGCRTDGIPGVQGVGELTAAKFIRKTLSQKSRSYRRIMQEGSLIARNRKLVKLPFKKARECHLQEEPPIRSEDWRMVTQSLGMDSLEGIMDIKRERAGLEFHG